MKHIVLTLIISWFALTLSEAQTNITRLSIVNLNAHNIEKVIFFKEHGIFQFDSLLVTGYLHASDTERIREAKKYLTDQKINFIKIKTISGNVATDSIFALNKWSKQFENIFKTSDGLIFFGGDDIPPSFYGEKTFLTTDIIDRARNWELSLMFHLIGGKQNPDITPLLKQDPDFAILGICLGMQIMNVSAGGSLYQDIPAQIYGTEFCEEVAGMPVDQQHKNYLYGINNTDNKTSYIAFHPISVKSNSFLKQLDYSPDILVPSVHHQAVKELGKDLNITATSKDGKVVEALEHSSYKNVYGIQFHIDFPVLYKSDAAFRISPEKKYLPSEKEKAFYKAIWKDYCKRVMN